MLPEAGMPHSYLPLRWESTGDQWWYASPIDCAAASGHYDLVRALLRLDPNLLIKLTSLRRIRRLETVWDDDSRFSGTARCRSSVARSLLHECEAGNRKNSLIRAGYGGWLLYTAASAGETSFVKELLERDPLLVFGEGEYGVSDMLYAAARSRCSEVFRLVLDSAASARCSTDGGGEGSVDVFRTEMTNRAVHAAARGGNLEMLKELLADCSDVSAYRDLQGATILHSASGRGQVEIVKDLIAFFDMVNSRDNQGNTSLHVAAFHGHLPVVEILVTASPALSNLTNNAGDTFFHMAVAGFRIPGFRRLDRQIELMKQMISRNFMKIEDIINARNNDGRTALHIAVIGNVHSDLIELLMTVKSIDLNIRDTDGMTPLDLLRQHPCSMSSDILIKQLASAGGISNSKDYRARSAIASDLKMQGIGNSPGTSFRVSDAEIFLCAGIEASESSGRLTSCSSTSKSEVSHPRELYDNNKKHSVDSAARRLKVLLTWKNRTTKKTEASNCEEAPTPLRQRFSRGTSLPNNKRTFAFRSSVPSSSATKKKVATGLMHGAVQAMPHRSLSLSSSSFFSSSVMSAEKQHNRICLENENGVLSCSDSSANNEIMDNASQKSKNTGLINQYFCFGSQGLAVEDAVDRQLFKRASRRSFLSVA